MIQRKTLLLRPGIGQISYFVSEMSKAGDYFRWTTEWDWEPIFNFRWSWLMGLRWLSGWNPPCIPPYQLKRIKVSKLSVAPYSNICWTGWSNTEENWSAVQTLLFDTVSHPCGKNPAQSKNFKGRDYDNSTFGQRKKRISAPGNHVDRLILPVYSLVRSRQQRSRVTTGPKADRPWAS